MRSPSRLFFAEVDRLNAGYPNLLQVGDSHRPEEGEGGDEGEDGGGGDGFLEKWGWIDAVRAVSDTTHEPWSAVWRQPMAETLTILSYISDKNEKDKRDIERQMARYGKR